MMLPILLPLTAILDLILWAAIFVVALRGSSPLWPIVADRLFWV